jgi:hypothetical protein
LNLRPLDPQRVSRVPSGTPKVTRKPVDFSCIRCGRQVCGFPVSCDLCTRKRGNACPALYDGPINVPPRSHLDVPLVQAAQNVVPVAVTAGDKTEGLRQ